MADMEKKADFTELGVPGLDQQGGFVDEDFLDKWKGRRKLKTIEEMRKNDPIIGASMLAIKNIIKGIDWSVDPPRDASQKEERVAEKLETARHDMVKPWKSFIGEAITMVPHGWSMFEMVLKRRNGNHLDPVDGSQYDDGLIGFKRFAMRSQDSLWGWEFDENNRPTHMVQEQWFTSGDNVPIPLDKCLHFRTTTEKDNPEGESALRTAYRPYYYKKRFEQIEGIGVERDLAGIPVIEAPPNIFSDDASKEEKETLEAIQKLLRNLKQDKEQGVALPAVYDDQGNKLMNLKLLSSEGEKSFDTNEIINRKSREMAMSFLADVIMLGHESVGSFALAQSKTNIFAQAMESYADEIADEFNRKAVPTFMKVNGWTDVRPPTLEHSGVETIDLDSLAKYVRSLSTAGIDLTGEDIQEELFDQMDMPLPENPGVRDGGSPASSGDGDTAEGEDDTEDGDE